MMLGRQPGRGYLPKLIFPVALASPASAVLSLAAMMPRTLEFHGSFCKVLRENRDGVIVASRLPDQAPAESLEEGTGRFCKEIGSRQLVALEKRFGFLDEA